MCGIYGIRLNHNRNQKPSVGYDAVTAASNEAAVSMLLTKDGRRNVHFSQTDIVSIISHSLDEL